MTTPIIITPLNPTPFVLDAEGRDLIDRAVRMLVRMAEPAYMARAQTEGYTPEEHQLGWELFTVAGGGANTAATNVAAAALTTADARANEAHLARLQQLDSFENLWFPRIRVIIRREVPEPRAAAFEAGFFEDLEQQPLGPTVVGSVAKLLARVTTLDTTPGSDGARVRAVLNQRGLTDERIAGIMALVAEMQAAGPPTAVAAAPSAADVAAINARREDALRRLDRWYDDWATTFRGIFTVREQIKLALTTSRGKPGKAKKSGLKAKSHVPRPAPVPTPTPPAAAPPAAAPTPPAPAAPSDVDDPTAPA